MEDGGLAKVRTLATRRQNPKVVRSYPEKGFAFVVSDGASGSSFQVDVLDFGDMPRERSVDFDFDACTGCAFLKARLLKARLLERGGRLVFCIHARGYGPDGASVSQFPGLDLRGGGFVRDIGRADATCLHHQGGQSGGVDGTDYMGGIYVRERVPTSRTSCGNRTPSACSGGCRPGSRCRRGGRLIRVANNDHARVLSAAGGGAAQRLVLDKSAGRWSRVPLSAEGRRDLRLLGRWPVREDVVDGFDRAAWRGAPDVDLEAVRFWTVADCRPPGSLPIWSAAGRASYRGRTPTGRLDCYDTRTGRLAAHAAGSLTGRRC